MTESLDAWFCREILVHEASLVRYLARTWRRQQDIDDLRQEIYVKVYEAAAQDRPHSPKSFLFVIARHCMISRIRRTRVVAIESLGDLNEGTTSVDELSPERWLDGRQQLRRLADAFNSLPPKCREVMWMRRIDGLSQKEVADRLGLSVRTVESHILRGMQLLAQSFLSHESLQPRPEAAATSDRDDRNGKHE